VCWKLTSRGYYAVGAESNIVALNSSGKRGTVHFRERRGGDTDIEQGNIIIIPSSFKDEMAIPQDIVRSIGLHHTREFLLGDASIERLGKRMAA
jgi:hypothetical protein